MPIFVKLLLIATSLFFSCCAQSEILASSMQGMVVTEHRLASQIGAEILRDGGNAIDAAVAVGYALAVVNPCCGNLGGGGFMVAHLTNGKDIFLNFREKAPLKATRTMFQHANSGTNSTYGYLSVAVPGTVLGLDTALKKYGTLSRNRVMAPAIRLAKEGFVVTPYLANQLTPAVTATLLKEKRLLMPGDKLIQHDLANTLDAIANQGPSVFYQGPIAKAIVNASQAQGGILSLDDFAQYDVEETTPVYCRYRDYTIISAAPPSSGGVTLCEMLQILENLSLNTINYRSPLSIHAIVEAMRYSYADRNSKLGDPLFVHNPIDILLSREYAKKISLNILRSTIAPKHTIANPSHELTDTTHYSVIDKYGNAVAVTYTLNGFFGSGMMAENTGFFLNNEMDDFATQPGVANKFNLVQQDANAIQSGKRPLSSMTPTIVMHDNHVFMIIGSPGGPRIITAVLLTLLNVLDYGMTIQQAVNAPRFHFQGFPDEINIEPFALPFATIKQLELNGYHITSQHTWSAVEAILVNPSNGMYFGANDIRRPDGKAVGV